MLEVILWYFTSLGIKSNLLRDLKGPTSLGFHVCLQPCLFREHACMCVHRHAHTVATIAILNCLLGEWLLKFIKVDYSFKFI